MSNRQLHRETDMGHFTCIIRDRQYRLYGHLARFLMDGPARQVVRETILDEGGPCDDLGGHGLSTSTSIVARILTWAEGLPGGSP